MEITEVRISPAKGGKVRAFASIVIDDCFIVNDLRIVEGREGQMLVSMPARKARSGQLRDVAHPLNAETRRRIEERVMAEFEQAVQNLVVPPTEGGAAERGRPSPLGRLSARLFSEDFWAADNGGSEDEGET